MSKRYHQVFVSSTYEDLREERQQVMQALLELDCIPSGMELFPAANEDQWTLIKRVIDDCDYYLVVVAGRYGSVGPDKKSYTQMEYEYAQSTNKPVIAFIHADPNSIPLGRTEPTEEGKKRLKEFGELLRQKMVRTWSSAEELGSVVSRSIVKLRQTHPAAGWVRADEFAEELAAPEILKHKKRIEELEERLQQFRHQPPREAEKLASGSEIFKIEFYTSFVDAKDEKPYTWELSSSRSWNNIFKTLSPLMIDRATESQLTTRLYESCKDQIRQKIRDDTLSAKQISIKLSPESLRTIIIQFRALGLIVKDERHRSVRDTQTYWTLTSYGDSAMTTLLAILSSKYKQRTTFPVSAEAEQPPEPKK